jgi:hypothetical protein
MMLEKDRQARNQQMLAEMYPTFRTRVQAVIKELESQGLRPRIQESWRSPQAQMEAFRSGHSQLMYGFHNVTAANGTKEALAADIIDDNSPLSLNLPYVIHLAAAAENNDLTTGIYWNITDASVAAIHAAVATKNWNAKLRIGWDPLHVEATGITPKEAQQGKRPYQATTPPPGDDGQPKPETPPPGDSTGEPATPPPGDSGSAPGTDQSAEKIVRYRVENLETHEVREYSWGTAFRPAVLLPVPYVSQLGAGAEAHKNDCGATSAVMLLRAYLDIHMTPDEFYTKFAIQWDPYLSVPQMRDAMSSQGLLTDFRANLALQDLFTFLAASKPVIVLLRYKVLEEAGLTEKEFTGPHFAVVVGIDSKNIYIHDPLYTNPLDGEAHPYPLDTFYKAWTDVGSDPNFPNPARSAIIPTGGIGFRTIRRVRVNIASLNVRSGPGPGNPVVSTLKKDQVVEITREMSGWGQVAVNQWIVLSFTVPADVPAG